MKRIIVAVVLASLVSPAYAGFMAEKIDEGVYFVTYERGRWTSGTVLDTARKAQRKLERKAHQLCLDEGYGYLRFPTLGEIGRDEELRAVWQVAVGDEGADSFQISGGDLGPVNKAHKVRRILFLAEAEQEGFDRCLYQ